MLWRACVALAAVIGTLLTTAATRSGGSDTALLLYTTYAVSPDCSATGPYAESGIGPKAVPTTFG
jgi:hypothetical protein